MNYNFLKDIQWAWENGAQQFVIDNYYGHAISKVKHKDVVKIRQWFKDRNMDLRLEYPTNDPLVTDLVITFNEKFIPVYPSKVIELRFEEYGRFEKKYIGLGRI